MPTPTASPDPLAAVPPPDVRRRELNALTRRRALVQSLLRTSVRIANYPPADADPRRQPAAATSH